MRASTESLLVQIDHLWALRSALAQLRPGSVLESADQLGSHLDHIRFATPECDAITAAASQARDHCLRFVLSCHQGGDTDALRQNTFQSLNAMEDAILAHRTVEDVAALLERADARSSAHASSSAPDSRPALPLACSAQA